MEERMGYDYEEEEEDFAREEVCGGISKDRKSLSTPERIDHDIEQIVAYARDLEKMRGAITRQVAHWERVMRKSKELQEARSCICGMRQELDTHRAARVEAERVTRGLLREYTALREALIAKGAPSDKAAMMEWINGLG